MLPARDSVVQSLASLRAHRLRTALTLVGLMMGVATLITVMTIVQGANVYVEQKIANLGTGVFQVARTPFAATDFNIILKALKHKHVELTDDATLAPGGCRIYTRGGRVDAALDEQLDRVIADLLPVT